MVSARSGLEGGLYTGRMNAVMVALGLAGLGGVAACAAPTSPADVPAETRILVKLVRPSTNAAVIARAASDAAALPVRYVSSTSAQWHALALRCGSAPECDAALQRLRADAATFEAVQRDERRHVVTP